MQGRRLQLFLLCPRPSPRARTSDARCLSATWRAAAPRSLCVAAGMDIAIVKTQPSGFFARENSTITPHATRSASSAPPAGAPAVAAAPAAADKDPQIDGCKGWITVLGSFIIHIWAIGMTYAFGVFIKPLQAEFGVRREPIVWLNGLCSFMLLASGIGTGYLADRCAFVSPLPLDIFSRFARVLPPHREQAVVSPFHSRWSYRGVALVGTFLIVLVMELSSIVTELWQMFFTYGIIQGIGGGFCFIPAVSVISEWFQIRRGLVRMLIYIPSSSLSCFWRACLHFLTTSHRPPVWQCLGLASAR